MTESYGNSLSKKPVHSCQIPVARCITVTYDVDVLISLSENPFEHYTQQWITPAYEIMKINFVLETYGGYIDSNYHYVYSTVYISANCCKTKSSYVTFSIDHTCVIKW